MIQVFLHNLQPFAGSFGLYEVPGIHIGQGTVFRMGTAGTHKQGVYLRMKRTDKSTCFQDLLHVICFHLHIHLGICQENIDVFKIEIKLSF